MDLEHPEITWALRTGYPSWSQPKKIYCSYCDNDISDEEVYEDEDYDCLCEDCLLKLHKKNS